MAGAIDDAVLPTINTTVAVILFVEPTNIIVVVRVSLREKDETHDRKKAELKKKKKKHVTCQRQQL